jgi:hypothetical protein
LTCVSACRSHKGSNLALMVELLAGPLVGAAVADKLEERNWGNLVLVIDPQLLGEPDVIKARTQVCFLGDFAVSLCMADAGKLVQSDKTGISCGCRHQVVCRRAVHVPHRWPPTDGPSVLSLGGSLGFAAERSRRSCLHMPFIHSSVLSSDALGHV